MFIFTSPRSLCTFSGSQEPAYMCYLSVVHDCFQSISFNTLQMLKLISPVMEVDSDNDREDGEEREYGDI